MGILDGPLSQVVDVLLNTFSDTPAEITRKVSAFDPATDSTVTTSQVVSLKTTPPEGYAAGLVDGTNIQVGDLQLYTGADYGVLVEPKPGDQVVRGSLKAVVIKVSPINSGDAITAYALQVRTP